MIALFPAPTRPITTIFSIIDALLSSYLSRNIFRLATSGAELQKALPIVFFGTVVFFLENRGTFQRVAPRNLVFRAVSGQMATPGPAGTGSKSPMLKGACGDGKAKSPGVCGSATFWNESAGITVSTYAPHGAKGGRLKHRSKCCVATKIDPEPRLPQGLWVINVHLVHDVQAERVKQLRKVLDWVDNYCGPPGGRSPVLLCGDFNANYGESDYAALRTMLGEYTRLHFDGYGAGACPITFPGKGTSLDFAFVRGIGGSVKVFDNQTLSDHNGLVIDLDGGLRVLCFNAHFGTDRRSFAQPRTRYAKLISDKGADIVCMQELDFGETCTMEQSTKPAAYARN